MKITTGSEMMSDNKNTSQHHQNDNGREDFVPEEQNKTRAAAIGLNCSKCFQPLKHVISLSQEDFPSDAQDCDEDIALVSIFEAVGSLDIDEDSMYKLKLEDYLFYDDEGHILPFDCGAIEKDKSVYMAGTIKAYSELSCEGELI